MRVYLVLKPLLKARNINIYIYIYIYLTTQLQLINIIIIIIYIHIQRAAAQFDNTTLSLPVPRKAGSVTTFSKHYVALHWSAVHNMSHVSFPRTYYQYQYHSNLNIFICTPVTGYEVLQISCKVKVHILGEKVFKTWHFTLRNIIFVTFVK